MSASAAYLYHLRTKNIVADIEAIKHLSKDYASLLEVGSGTGRILFSLNHINKRCGIELNPDFYRFSQENTPAANTASLINADFLKAEIHDTYDVVLLAFNVMSEFLELDSRIALLEKCKSLLNKNGRIIVINDMHNFASWSDTEKTFNFPLHDEQQNRDWHCQIICARNLAQQTSQCHITYTSDADTVTDSYTSALITRNELLLLYKAAKLHACEEYGSYALTPLTDNSEMLIHVLK